MTLYDKREYQREWIRRKRLRRKYPLITAIRVEYGEPFSTVVKGYAIMGFSRRATAKALNVDKEYFRKLIAIHAPDAPWQTCHNRRIDCKPWANKKGKIDYD